MKTTESERAAQQLDVLLRDCLDWQSTRHLILSWPERKALRLAIAALRRKRCPAA